MIAIDNTLVSEDLLDKKFVCDLSACKGACCVAGNSGAPLEQEEINILENIYEDVKPYMSREGIAAVEEQGFYVVDEDNELALPLVNDKQCVFVTYEKNIAKCAIEKAHAEGKTEFKKPISCHLYPVRINKYKDYDAVNYHQWEICKPACECGDKLDVPVFRFLREPLLRKYGEEWFKQLDMVFALRKK